MFHFWLLVYYLAVDNGHSFRELRSYQYNFVIACSQDRTLTAITIRSFPFSFPIVGHARAITASLHHMSSPLYTVLLLQMLSFTSSPLQACEFRVDGAVSGQRVYYLVWGVAGERKIPLLWMESILWLGCHCFPTVINGKYVLHLRRKQLWKVLHLQSATLHRLPKSSFLYMRNTCVSIITLTLNYLAQATSFHYHTREWSNKKHPCGL